MNMQTKSLTYYLPAFLVKFFTKGHERSVRAKKNIGASFFLKGITLAIGFVRVPIALDYLNVTEYGIWLTLSSIIAWLAFFDIGLGNGLRNKLAEALAKGDNKLAQIYVSTTYAILTIIITAVYLICIIISQFVDWVKILNTSPDLAGELQLLVFVVITSFALRFVFGLITTVLTADQKPAIGSCISVIGSIFYLIVLIILSKTTSGSLVYLAIASGGSSLIFIIMASIYLYSNTYRVIRPSLNAIQFKYFRDLGSLGIKFFLVQIAAVILFSTDNMIITQVLGPEHVTPYNIARKYMGLPLMAFSIIMWPLWSAYTEAYVKDDFIWIKRITAKLLKICVVFSAGVLLMLLFSSTFYKIWLGDRVQIPLILSFIMGLYYAISLFAMVFTFFINGIGKIQLQVYIAIYEALINIPLSIYFALKIGVAGVILATLVTNISGIVLIIIQYYKIVNKKAYGIWAK